MRILSIDTSSSIASIALAVDERLMAESLFPCERTLSARLMPEIERLLAMAGLTALDIDLFACAIGPGSFTGVRIGVATVQGLALATGKPCVGFSNLALLAMNFPLAAHPVCTLVDARKSEVYAALYDNSAIIPVPLINECVTPPERILDLIQDTDDKPVIFVGDGAQRYGDIISSRMGERAIFAPFTHQVGHAANGTLMALDSCRKDKTLEPAQLLPLYLRASEAEYAKLDRQKSIRAKQVLL